ncbi:hypothetical protein GCM10011374_29800 [Kocuria dechangensis]|uniref:Uncharacterized protein n=1 Tax=Kocuria dechangensis TaxID=1176249 RepID=A0A917H168_9MICC|nr:hypothetical protein [Kocuria dechangensis]GGG64267.1 hypothetical protein GCM10011374_29800 [Kocuria dechangensis]
MRHHHPSVASTSAAPPSAISRRGLLTSGTALTALAVTGVTPSGGAAPAHAAVAPATQAVAGGLADANLFEILEPVRVVYSRSSIAGTPLVSYEDAGRQLSFRGEEITRVGATWGELVTVTIEHLADAFIRTFTLIVPTVRVAPGAEAEFETLGIETTDRSSAFVLPPGPSGALQSYRIHQLHGMAQHVTF